MFLIGIVRTGMRGKDKARLGNLASENGVVKFSVLIWGG